MEKSKLLEVPGDKLPLHRRIRKLITAGKPPPGTQLSPVTLADRFGLSTTPVREALNRLVGEGLVVQEKGGGYMIPMPSARQLQYQTEFLTTLLKTILTDRMDLIQRSPRATLSANRIDHDASPDKVADILLDLFEDINTRHSDQALAESVDHLIGRCAYPLRIYLRDQVHRRQEVCNAQALAQALDDHNLDYANDLMTGLYERLAAEAERIFQSSLKDRYEADEGSVDRFY